MNEDPQNPGGSPTPGDPPPADPPSPPEGEDEV